MGTDSIQWKPVKNRFNSTGPNFKGEAPHSLTPEFCS